MLPLVNDAFLALKPYVPGKPVAETERELGITGCIKLASNENPYGPSPLAVQAIQAGLQSLHDYPDGGTFALKGRLATFLGVNANQLIFGNGTNEIINMVARTCMRPGENMLYASASFIAYKLIAQAMGQPLREVPLRDMRYDLQALAEAADAQTKLVFIANPNNPTGTYISRDALRDFLKALPEHVLVVLDEAYFEYATAPDYPNGIHMLHERERFMVTRTFSKCYGLAGIRVGYGVANAELIDFMNRGRDPFNINSLAQLGAAAALDDTAHVQKSRDGNRTEMERLVPQLQERGLTVVSSQANFVLVDFHKPAAEIFQKLLRQGVIVRPVDNYGLPTWQRITIGTPQQNVRLMAAIAAL